MNLKYCLILGLGLISFWLAGCATCETPETNYAAYSTDDLLELVGVDTNNLMMSGDMLRKNDRRYAELRRRADIVLENYGNELKFISSKVQTNLPKGKFPVEDIGKYFPPNSTPVNLVVIACDFEPKFIASEFDDSMKIMNTMKKQLLVSGARHVEIQAHEWGLWMEIRPEEFVK